MVMINGMERTVTLPEKSVEIRFIRQIRVLFPIASILKPSTRRRNPMNMYHLLSGFSLMVVVVMGGFVHAESNDETLYTSRPNPFRSRGLCRM